MEKLTALVIAGIITEGVTEVIKQLKKDGRLNATMLISILVGEGVAFATQIDILKMLGFEQVIPFFGIAVTGLLISRGSNYIADLVTRLTAVGKEEAITYIFEDEVIEDKDIDEVIEELENSIK